MGQTLYECKSWVENFVLRHNLCPFAHQPHQDGRIRYHQSIAKNTTECLQELLDEINILEHDQAQTTLIVYAEHQDHFNQFLQLLDLMEELLAMEGWEGQYQLVGFHPQYQFSDSSHDDPANATNRSPHPMVHILRWADVQQAVDNHPDVHSIPKRNIKLLRSIADNIK